MSDRIPKNFFYINMTKKEEKSLVDNIVKEKELAKLKTVEEKAKFLQELLKKMKVVINPKIQLNVEEVK